MSRILFAWELGGGFGHLGPFRPIAQALIARGHQLTLAVRDIERANIVFNSLAVKVVQAPLCTKTYSGLSEPPLNYAEILVRYGYLDAPLLGGMLRAWRGLFDLTQPEVLIADHAPTALLAARGRGTARAVTGSPFTVPPPLSPTPNMRPWVRVPEQRLTSSDASVLKTINASLLPGTSRLRELHEIFDGVDHLMTGVPELDPYGPRDARGYLGLYAGQIGSAPPGWPEGEGPRVFAYLNSDYRHIESTLAALAASNTRCLVYLMGATPAVRQKYQSSRLAFSADLLDLDRVVAGCDLFVCHGNFGTVMEVLRRGKPMLLLPAQLEHFLLSSSLEKLGIARMAHSDEQPLDIGAALAQALKETSLADAARKFALRHREPAVDTIIERAADRIETLARGNPG